MRGQLVLGAIQILPDKQRQTQDDVPKSHTRKQALALLGILGQGSF